MATKKAKVYPRIKIAETKTGDKIQFCETPRGEPIHHPIVYTRVMPSDSEPTNWLVYEDKNGKEAKAYLECHDIRVEVYEVLLIEKAKPLKPKKGAENQGTLF